MAERRGAVAAELRPGPLRSRGGTRPALRRLRGLAAAGLAILAAACLQATEEAVEVSEPEPPLSPNETMGEELPEPVYNAVLDPLVEREPLRVAPDRPVELRFHIGPRDPESVLGQDASIPEALRVAEEPTTLGVAFDCHVCTESASQSGSITYDPEAGVSDAARFTFVPRRSTVAAAGGLGRLALTVTRDGVELNAVEIQVLVGEPTEEARAAYRPPRVHRVGPLPEEVEGAPDLVLYVGPAAGTTPVPVRLEARDPELAAALESLLDRPPADETFESGVSRTDLEELARRIYLRLSEIVLERNPGLDSLYAGEAVGAVELEGGLRLSPGDSAAVVAALGREGRELFRRLFAHGADPLPAVLATVEEVGRARYAEGAPLRIRIHNAGPWIPWQLLASVWEGAPDDPERFWGIRYALGVRQSLPGRDGPVTTAVTWPGDRELVLASHREEARITARAARLQEALVGHAGAAVARPDGRDLLLEELRRSADRLKFLLVFTHGRSGGADPGGYPGRPQLLFAPDDVLTPTEVDALGDAIPPTLDAAASLFLGAQPVVVLNACESGTGGLRPTTNNNFVGSFLRLGASAVVATESSVGIGFASSFAGDLSTEVFSGVPVADAVRRTRVKHLEEKGSALGLVYSLYGNPSAHFERAGARGGP
jgi:hypothetical protein